MIHTAAVLFILLVGSALTASAQQKGEDISVKNTSPDTMLVNNEVQEQGFITNMPIYNPRGADAKVLVLKPPKKWTYNMPIVGKKWGNSLSKNLLKKWPGDINKDQKDKPAEQK